MARPATKCAWWLKTNKANIQLLIAVIDQKNVVALFHPCQEQSRRMVKNTHQQPQDPSQVARRHV